MAPLSRQGQFRRFLSGKPNNYLKEEDDLSKAEKRLGFKPDLGQVLLGTCTDGRDRFGEVTSMAVRDDGYDSDVQIVETRKVNFDGKTYYVKPDEGKEKRYSIPLKNIKKKLADPYQGHVTTEYGIENKKLAKASPDGIIRRTITIGAPPPAHNEQKINEIYNKMVKFMKEWDSYSKLDKQTLKRLYQQTSRIDYGEMRDSDKGTLIAGIMESKYGRKGFPSDDAKRLEALTGESADSWQRKAVREAKGRPLPPPKPIPTKPSAVEPTDKAPSSGPRRFQNQNRLGWTKEGYKQFVELTKPGSIWDNVKKNAKTGAPMSWSTEDLKRLKNLFENEAKYIPLANMFGQLINLSYKKGTAEMSEFRSIVERIKPRLERLWDFSRREALAKSIVMKSLNSRKMI